MQLGVLEVMVLVNFSTFQKEFILFQGGSFYNFPGHLYRRNRFCVCVEKNIRVVFLGGGGCP